MARVVIASFSAYVELIEKRVASGIWVTARNGGTSGTTVTFNVSPDSCPAIGERVKVTVERTRP